MYRRVLSSSSCFLLKNALKMNGSSRCLASSTYFAGMPVKGVNVPTMGDSITTGVIVDIPSPAGTFVNEDDVVVVLETDKVSVDVRAEESGMVKEIYGDIDDEKNVGDILYDIDTDAQGEKKGDGGSNDASESSDSGANEAPPAEPTPAPPSPTPPPPPPPPQQQQQQQQQQQPAETPRSESVVKMSRMRQRVATRLKDAQNTAAMLTTFQEVDMGSIMEIRKKYKDDFQKKHDIKLGFMSTFVYASTMALKAYPSVNAYILGNDIIYRNYTDISVAVASPGGLVVPVLRDTQDMSFSQIESTIADYGKKASNGTLALEDMAGGTFTISNGGVFGSLMGTPIINPPQSAILGMHATKLRPVVIDGEVCVRPMMYLALTYDHRLIDGREGVGFLKTVKELVEDPVRMLIDV